MKPFGAKHVSMLNKSIISKVFWFLQAYGVVFIRNVKHRHTMARKYFSQIPLMTEYLHDVDSKPAAHSKLLVARPVATVTK